jgi:uridine kinase
LDIEEIVREVNGRRAPRVMATRIVAVDGPGGAGKSVLADRLAAAFGGAQVVHTDDFASWDDPVDWWPRLLEAVLEPLSRGEPGTYRPTSWDGTDRAPVHIVPADVVVLEGVTASREVFRPYLTFAIWVETPRELRLQRGLERDGEEARSLWERWMAEEDAYVRRERPAEHADCVVRGDTT